MEEVSLQAQRFCQSCGMPLADEVQFGTNADGSKNEEYCLYCYKDGNFTAAISMEEMARFCATHLTGIYKGMTEAEANNRMLDILPALKRWHTAEIKEISRPQSFYLALAGKGAPELCAAYGASFDLLYGVFAALEEVVKQRGYSLFCSVPHTLWYLEGGQDFRTAPRSEWLWVNMIELPSFVTKDDLEAAKKALPVTTPLAEQIYLEELHEGTCLQALHIGPYETMCDTVASLDKALAKRGGKKNGRHHDLYVSDPRTTPPAKLATLIRIPVTDL